MINRINKILKYLINDVTVESVRIFFRFELFADDQNLTTCQILSFRLDKEDGQQSYIYMLYILSILVRNPDKESLGLF